MTSETRQILIGPGHQSWCFTHDPNLEGPETINETYDIRVDGLNILLREQRIIFKPVIRENYFLPIANHQIYVHGTIEERKIVPFTRGEGVIYIVRPIGDRTELADKIACLVRERFPDFAGELSFDSRDI